MVLKVVIEGFTRAGMSAGSMVANWPLCYIHEATRLDLIVPVFGTAASQLSGNSKLMTQSEIEQRVAGPEDRNSESLLIGGCMNCIEQCDQILSIVSQKNFTDGSKGSSSIGAHIRHILDRFHCFFAGLTDASIDYDARKRDREIEQNLEAATFALASVARRIEQLKDSSLASEPICVKESVLPFSPAVETSSTVERELMGLITHSIHHLAIISLLA